MPRLKPELIERVEMFADRVTDVAEELDRQGRFRRIVDQVVGSGTSVGANMCEADEALSRPDFCKTLGIVLRELSETRYWLRFVARRAWIKEARLQPLIEECSELRAVCGSMLARTKKRGDKR
jgi:four helix bundle protein